VKQKAKFFFLLYISTDEFVQMFPMVFVGACDRKFKGLQNDVNLSGIVPLFKVGFDVTTSDALVFQFYF
jgi:hypothetical protein